MGVASSSQSSPTASQLNNKAPSHPEYSEQFEYNHDAAGAEEQHFSGGNLNTTPGNEANNSGHSAAADHTALRFHDVCGKNIEFLNAKRMAKRKEDHFCDAIVFSHRPIGVYERVCVKVVKLSSFWNGMMRFGFTSVNPDIMNPSSRRAMSLGGSNGASRGHQQPGRMDSLNGSHSSSLGEPRDSNNPAASGPPDEADDLSSLELPKYVYPDLTNKEGYWAASMAENSIKENDVLYFYVNSSGEIHYGINEKYQGLFLDGIDVYRNRPRQAQPLWAIFDIYGNTIAIEFVQPVNKYPNGGSSQQYVKQSNQTAVVMNSNLTSYEPGLPMPSAATNYGGEQVNGGNNYRTLTSINSLGSNGSSIRSTGSSMQVSTSSNPSTLSSINSSNVAPTIVPRATSQLVTATAVSSRSSRTFDNNNAAPTNGGTNGDVRYLAKVISSAGQSQSQTSSSTNDAEDQLDQLLISCRRLCVDNHLNETLHNSLVQLQNPIASVTSTPPTSTATAFSSPPAPTTANYNSRSSGVTSAAASNPNATSTPTFEPSASVQSNELTNMIRRVYESIPILLHEPITCSRTIKNKFMTNIHGRNVKISQPDRLIAYRPSSLLSLTDRLTSSSSSASSSSSSSTGSSAFKKPTTNGYVFLETPVERGHSFCIQIVGLDQSAHESSFSLGIGCTTCVPSTLNQQIDLPDDADELVDRSEYWVVYKNLFTSNGLNANGVASADHRMHAVSVADELCFRLEDSSCGNVNFYINGRLKTKCLFSVDVTQKLWFFFDLCGRTSAIRLIPPCSHISTMNSGNLTSSTAIISTIQVRQSADELAGDSAASATSTGQRRPRPNSALIDYFKNQIMLNHATAAAAAAAAAATDLASSANRSDLVASPVSAAAASAPPAAKNEATSSSSSVSQQEECRICWEAPIECVFYSCGHMCLCWNCASRLKKQATRMSTSSAGNTDPTKKLNKYPLCPICRMEIIDIIRFFKS